MTCREKLKIEHPHEVGVCYIGGCFGCPSHYHYLDTPLDCNPIDGKSNEKCTKCWDREIPGTEETKDKSMELNEKFAKMTFAELVDTAVEYVKEIENLIDYKKHLYCMLSDSEDINKKKDEKIEFLLKHNQYIRDANRLRAEKDKEKIESLEKDITHYMAVTDERNQRLDEKEAKILNMQETIDFQERHIQRIEGELKLYKGMKGDNNKTDYTKPEKIEPMFKWVSASEPIGNLVFVRVDGDGTHIGLQLTPDAAGRLCQSKGGHIAPNGSMLTVGDFVEPANLCTMPDIDELSKYKGEGHPDPVGEPGTLGETGYKPICSTVPSSAVIGKIHLLKADWFTQEEPNVVFKLSKDAVKKLTGKHCWKDTEYLIMPTDIYNDVLNKDLEEHMKKYRDMFDQYKYYSRFLDTPCMNITPDTLSDPIPPVAKDYKAIGEHIHRKFEALIEAGFTEDQAMSLIPMWTDDEEN